MILFSLLIRNKGKKTHSSSLSIDDLSSSVLDSGSEFLDLVVRELGGWFDLRQEGNDRDARVASDHWHCGVQSIQALEKQTNNILMQF